MKEKVNAVRDALFRYNNTHRNFMDAKFREKGLYFGQPPIIKHLSEYKNSNQKEIADALHVTPPSIATSLKRMEEAGLVVRTESKTDARRNTPTLTKKGKELSEYADNMFLRMDDVTYSGFTEEELDMLICFIERMNNNLIEFFELQHAKEDQNV